MCPKCAYTCVHETRSAKTPTVSIYGSPKNGTADPEARTRDRFATQVIVALNIFRTRRPPKNTRVLLCRGDHTRVPSFYDYIVRTIENLSYIIPRPRYIRRSRVWIYLNARTGGADVPTVFHSSDFSCTRARVRVRVRSLGYYPIIGIPRIPDAATYMVGVHDRLSREITRLCPYGRVRRS